MAGADSEGDWSGLDWTGQGCNDLMKIASSADANDMM